MILSTSDIASRLQRSDIDPARLRQAHNQALALGELLIGGPIEATEVVETIATTGHSTTLVLATRPIISITQVQYAENLAGPFSLYLGTYGADKSAGILYSSTQWPRGFIRVTMVVGHQDAPGLGAVLAELGAWLYGRNVNETRPDDVPGYIRTALRRYACA